MVITKPQKQIASDPCLRSSSCSGWNGPADSAGSCAPPPAPRCVSVARRSSPERRTGELAGWTPGWTGWTGSEGAPAPQALGQRETYFIHKHITNIYSWHFIQDHRTHRSVQLQSWIFWTQLQDNGDHRWSCVVHAAYRLSSAGLGSGGSWVVVQCSPPGETTPHRHLDTSVLLLLLLVLPMMKMPELHSLLLKSEIWNITSQRPLTVF